MSMAKFKDKSKCRLKADIYSFVKGESAADRHRRRLEVNKKNLDRLKVFCANKRYSMELCDSGTHWRIEKNGVEIDWFPSTAKFVVNQQWRHGIHVHDISQVICYLTFLDVLLMPRAGKQQ